MNRSKARAADARRGLTLALTRGRILGECLPPLAAAGIVPSEDPGASRKLVIATSQPGVRLLVLRGSDVPVYVRHGAADAGIVGRDVLEAAEIDGASPWHRFWTIEVPLISPTFFFVAITTVMNVLDDIVGTIDVLTGGGPYGQSSNILYYMYQRGLGFFQFGQASAAAVLIILLVIGVTWLQFRMFERKVHYGS